MIASFKDGATEDIFNGVNSKRARKACPAPYGRWPPGNWISWTQFNQLMT